MASKGNEQNIENLKNEVKTEKVKVLDITDGAPAPTEEEYDGVAKLMCEFMDFYPRVCNKVEELIKPFVKVVGNKKQLMYMEDAFVKCLKEIPKFVDDNVFAYERFIKPKFNLEQQNVIYSYVGNAWVPTLLARCFSDVLIGNGIEPVFRCKKVKVGDNVRQDYKDVGNNHQPNSPKGVMN